MKPIDTGGISWIQPVPGGTAEWYFGMDYTHGDLYEAEELFRAGRPVLGRSFCLVRYPDGTVFRPLPKEPGTYCEEPVFLDGAIYLLRADFPTALLSILRFDCGSGAVGAVAELPLSAVRDCYNLKLHTAPLCLTRQGGEGVFEILWPERVSFPLGARESFYLREGDRLFFNRWNEEGEHESYRYWEQTLIRDLKGRLLETLPGDVARMPNGELWHLK